MTHLLSGLAANPSLPPDLVDRLIAFARTEPDGGDVAAELAGRADLGRARAAALVSGAEESVVRACAVRLAERGWPAAADVDPAAQPYVALALLGEGAGRPEWARLLAADPVAERRELLAGCPALPSDVVARLAADPDVRVVAELALWAAPDVAAGLARHPHAEVRRAVAANASTPAAVLTALLTGEGLPPARRCLVCDQEETPFLHDRECPRPDCALPPGAACDGSHESTLHETRRAALANPATPAEAAAGYADHPSLLLRWSLAARQDLPPPVYARLAADEAPGVRADVAANPAVDESLLRVLAGDRSPDVRRELAHHPRLPLDLLADLAATTRIGATLLPRVAAASPAEVAELAASPVPALRMLVARRRDLPPEIRSALARDPDAKVAKSVAAHPGLDEGQLRVMLARHGAQVAASVAANPDATPALLEELAGQRPPARRALREIAGHCRATAPALLACLADPRARPVAAGHPGLPPRVIAELLRDDDRQVSEAAAANPSLPHAVMAKHAALTERTDEETDEESDTETDEETDEEGASA
ncbi:hypothetical protein ACFYO9_28585 [Streptomyces sp. NPDC005863]|uniref:hypothetical protein n=1 Tax=unclassified Streptomyces TaxID=2593676 RepID=UPI0033F7DF22